MWMKIGPSESDTIFFVVVVYSAKSSKDVEELKTDSETYRRNLWIHLYQPFSSLKDWPWGWEERTGRK